MRYSICLAAVAVCACSFAAEITQLKPLYPRTELIVDGAARCIIVTPEHQDLTQVADALASRLEAVGGARP